jgi:arsenite-transporting ATPase
VKTSHTKSRGRNGTLRSEQALCPGHRPGTLACEVGAEGRAKPARIIVYTGKGGVGKTSVAAATGTACAARGYRTLVISTDVAHSLGDAFDLELGPEPTAIAPGLWGQESEVYHNVRRHWGTIQQYVKSVFQWRGLDEVLAEEMTILPGMDDLASLLWIAEHHDRGEFDVIVVDAAPTGDTLRLLSLPEVGRWWLEKFMPVQRRLVKVAGPLVRRVIGMPLPDESVFAATEQLFHKLDHMHAILSDPDRASVRVVLNLEKMVIKEAQRSFTYLHLYGYPTDLVICNRVLPAEAGGYFEVWEKAQRRYWPMVREAFEPVPVRQAPWFEREVVGRQMLETLARAIFGQGDPTEFFYRGRPYRVSREDGEFVLSLDLPFASREDVTLLRRGDELVLEVGSWRRNLILPRVLVAASTKGARFDGQTLNIRFTNPAATAGGTQDARSAGRGKDHARR